MRMLQSVWFAGRSSRLAGLAGSSELSYVTGLAQAMAGPCAPRVPPSHQWLARGVRVSASGMVSSDRCPLKPTADARPKQDETLRPPLPCLRASFANPAALPTTTLQTVNTIASNDTIALPRVPLICGFELVSSRRHTPSRPSTLHAHHRRQLHPPRSSPLDPSCQQPLGIVAYRSRDTSGTPAVRQ